jgi:hypothetical protein
MDSTNAALTYGLLLIPCFFAAVVIAQGITKLKKHDESGKGVLLFGILFLLVIPILFFVLVKI